MGFGTSKPTPHFHPVLYTIVLTNRWSDKYTESLYKKQIKNKFAYTLYIV